MNVIGMYDGNLSIVDLYEDLRKYMTEESRAECDDMFYDAPEGEAQFDILKELLAELAKAM